MTTYNLTCKSELVGSKLETAIRLISNITSLPITQAHRMMLEMEVGDRNIIYITRNYHLAIDLEKIGFTLEKII